MPPRFLLILAVSALWLAAGGCAAQPAPRPAPIPAGHATSEADYPAWTKAAGWLLLPFTGASQSFGF